VNLPPDLAARCLALAATVDGKPAAAPPPPPPTEKAFTDEVIGLACRLGWMVYHTHDSRRSAAGFPDLVLVRNVVLFADLKTDAGKTTPDQEAWLTALRAAGELAEVWRPKDWPAILSALR
jgi:hypothetical protein